MKQRRAFTLIELLVVIAIIAILAAILFPVFAQAKVAAKKASSISNSKQTALAQLMYTNDYDDTFTWAQPGNWEWAQTWLINVQPYIKTFQIFISPMDMTPRPSWSGPPFSYPGNSVVCWDWQVLGGWKFIGVNNARQNWWKNYTTDVTTTGVGLPAETVLLAERHKAYNIWSNPWAQVDITGAWDSNWSTFLGWTSDLPGQGAGALWGKPTNSPGMVSNVYNGVATFSFCDGHAAAIQPIKTVNTAGYNNGNCDTGYFKMWDATRTN